MSPKDSTLLGRWQGTDLADNQNWASKMVGSGTTERRQVRLPSMDRTVPLSGLIHHSLLHTWQWLFMALIQDDHPPLELKLGANHYHLSSDNMRNILL
jgi:hypothetical protein